MPKASSKCTSPAERLSPKRRCGMTSTGLSGQWRQNQCLYLSLAAASRGPNDALQQTAEEIREEIETAVRAARPNWQHQDFLGGEVGAFADFLISGLQPCSKLRGKAVAVYDARVGSCEVYRPPAEVGQRYPVLALWFSGNHYRWVKWKAPGPSLRRLLALHRLGPVGSPRVATLVTTTAG